MTEFIQIGDLLFDEEYNYRFKIINLPSNLLSEAQKRVIINNSHLKDYYYELILDLKYEGYRPTTAELQNQLFLYNDDYYNKLVY